MESRLFDLILNEDASYLERGTGDTWAPSTTSHGSAAPSGLRTLKHDQQSEIGPDLIDPRLFEHQKPSEILAQALAGSTSAEETLQTYTDVGPHGTLSIPRHGGYNRSNDESRAPLTGVLNKSPSQTVDNLLGGELRKRKRPETGSSRILPTPPGSDKRPGKRHGERPLLPPLLAPLHEPPPNARVVPSISDNAFGYVQGGSNSLQENLSIKGKDTPVEAGTPTGRDKILLPSAQNQSTLVPNIKSKKNRWTERETRDLLQGVARFGIGSWKKILSHPDFKFDRRTAVDLKDRFRTCCRASQKGPNSSNNASSLAGGDAPGTGASKASSAAISQATPVAKRASGARSTDAERLLALGMSTSFPKRNRRGRRQFTEEEDLALLKGFHKHQAQWKKIQQDAELNFNSRSRTDLRDRFRNRYPEIFTGAGYKGRFQADKRAACHEHSQQDGQVISFDCDNSRPKTGSPPLEQSEVADCITPLPSRPSFAAIPSRPIATRLLATTAYDCVNFAPGGPGSTDDDPSAITLSRNIFRWATPHHKASTPTQTAPKTLSRLDQFHINPLLTLKGPSTSTNDSSGPSLLSFPLPALPLAGILNGPVSLPPPSELISSFEPDR